MSMSFQGPELSSEKDRRKKYAENNCLAVCRAVIWLILLLFVLPSNRGCEKLNQIFAIVNFVLSLLII